MKSTSYHLSRKFQVSPEDTLTRLNESDASETLKRWAGSIVWFNGGFLDCFESFTDNLPPIDREFEKNEGEVDSLLESVGFSLVSGHWPTKREAALAAH